MMTNVLPTYVMTSKSYMHSGHDTTDSLLRLQLRDPTAELGFINSYYNNTYYTIALFTNAQRQVTA